MLGISRVLYLDKIICMCYQTKCGIYLLTCVLPSVSSVLQFKRIQCNGSLLLLLLVETEDVVELKAFVNLAFGVNRFRQLSIPKYLFCNCMFRNLLRQLNQDCQLWPDNQTYHGRIILKSKYELNTSMIPTKIIASNVVSFLLTNSPINCLISCNN